jgi:hypothetical protein
MREMRNVYKTLVIKLRRKGPHGRTRCRWKDNIRMDVREIGREGVDWMHVAQDRDHLWALVTTVMKFHIA